MSRSLRAQELPADEGLPADGRALIAALETLGWVRVDGPAEILRHPRLANVWPAADAARLEGERARRDLVAIQLLGPPDPHG